MRFYQAKRDQHKLQYDVDVCLCHKERVFNYARIKYNLCIFRYNHCIANNDNGEIPEIVPTFDVNQLNFTETFVKMSQLELERRKTTTTTTTEAPEVRQAMGYEACFTYLIV